MWRTARDTFYAFCILSNSINNNNVRLCIIALWGAKGHYYDYSYYRCNRFFMDAHYKMDKELLKGSTDLKSEDQSLKTSYEPNITEQNLAFKVALEYEEHFRMALENIPLVALQTDLNGNIIYCNQYLREISQYTNEEIIGHNWFGKFVPSTYPNVKEDLLRGLREANLIKHLENPILTKNGEERLIEWSNTLLLDPDGNVIGMTSIGADITERKKAEEKLRKSEDGYRDLIENCNDLICTHDLDGNILSFNNAALKITGYSIVEILQGNLRDILVPEYRRLFDAYLNKIKARGEANGSMIIKTKAGEKRVWEYNNTLRKEGIANPIVRGMVKDVTEQKRAELEARVLYEITNGVTTTANLNELVKLIHRSISKVIYAENCFVAMYDEDTKLFSFPYFVDKFDPTPPPLALEKSCTAYVFRTGKPLLLTPEVSQQLEEQNEVELIGAPSSSWIGVPLKTPTITIGVLVLQHYEEENAYSCRDVQFLDSVGSQIALVIERKKAEDELRESEEMFRRLFDESSDSILLLDETGFTSCNSSTVSLLKYSSKEEILNKKPWEISPEKQPDGMLSLVKANMMIDKAIAEGYNRFEWIHTKSDGSEFPVEVMLTPIQLKGKQCLYTIMRDISEQKKAELIIRQKNEQLQELNSAKDKLFSIIAHDLRNPFHGFLSLTKMIAEETDTFSKEELSKIGNDMNQTANNIYSLLKNLLEWAQMQKGANNFEPEEISLSDLIAENVKAITNMGKQKGIKIINKVTATVPVFVDEKMINSVLSNLLWNAVKFTDRNGKVTISSKKIENEMIEISVNDTGTGIEKSIINKLFTVGEKTSRAGTEGEPSTGLGLLLCKEFVEKNGGKIWVESEKGVGSTFYFTLRTHK